jgi:hypothetical protein
MKEWKSVTGQEILNEAGGDKGIPPSEAILEDVIKNRVCLSSDGKCNFYKFYHTDGLGMYKVMDEGSEKIAFAIHECKAGDVAVGKTMRGHITCLKKALLQSIMYYLKIKTGKYLRFTKSYEWAAKAAGYSEVNKFVIDNFKMFYITTNKFCCRIPVDKEILSLIGMIEKVPTEKSPSTSWSDFKLRDIVENNFPNLKIDLMPEEVDIRDVGTTLNSLLENCLSHEKYLECF